MHIDFIDLSPEKTPLMSESATSNRAWLAGDITVSDWLITIEDAALAEIGEIVERMHAQPLPTILRTVGDVEIPNLQKLFRRAKDVLDDGCGFAVLSALPMDDYPVEDMVSCFWLLGQLIGTPVAQKWDGTMIYDVTDTGQKFGYGVRGSYTNVELVFHTDNASGVVVPDYVGLLCKYPAKAGGMSRFCSLYSLHNRMLEAYPEFLQRLYDPMLFDRQAEHAEGAPKTTYAPFFSWRNGKLAVRANVSLIRKGYNVAGEVMDTQLSEALDAVEEVSNAGELWYEAPIERGQMQFLSNHELGHYRSTFEDHANPEIKRHLFRTWHRNSGRRTFDGI